MAKSKSSVGLFAFLLIALMIVGAVVFTLRKPPNGGPGAQTLRITFTPYPDTSLFYYGMKKGFFKEEGIELDVKNLTWNEQVEFTAGRGTDIAMATLDEVVAKSKNLTAIDKSVVYFLPAWLFEGTIFVCRGNVQTFSELKAVHGEAEAKRRFLAQLKGKIIAVPESGVYDNAIRRFIQEAGDNPKNFNFVNTQLETGINGLSDENVAIAAAGAFERPEAIRRGYKIALEPADLGILVITGFICSKSLFESDLPVLEKFSRAWYRTVQVALHNQDESYEIVKEHLNSLGSKPITLTDYKAALAGNQFPHNPEEAKNMFFEQESNFYWRKAWDGAVNTLRTTGKADQVPGSIDAFKAEILNQRLLNIPK